ncbi:MAG: low molecular weight phosphotyrosine protein phosphatase [Salinisphaera sp.]|nr:low molecular weight phosphotyrosine protein phosphatase [Salinisphaera sp.]
MNDDQPRIRVLFVCLGNICRSPTAHGILRARLVGHALADRIEVASAGTGTWHIGSPPDERAMAAAAARNIDISDLRARKVASADFADFDYVIAMDHENLADLQALADAQADARARLALLGDFSPRFHGQPVGDPYYGGDDGFEQVIDMIESCVDGLIEELADTVRR